MLEYDPNLPQEFGRPPSRTKSRLLVVILVLAAVVLMYALVALLPLVSRYQL